LTATAPRARAPLYIAALDSLGEAARRLGLRSDGAFSVERLCRAARDRVGAEDFGAPEVEAPLQALLSSFVAESRASQTGRIAMLAHLRDLLDGRLRLQHQWDLAAGGGRPVEDEPLARPVFVFGLPRTGTTLLHNLIAQDPAVRVPWTWEVMLPADRPRVAGEAARCREAARKLAWVDRLAPAFRTVHAVDALLPQECIAITAYAFQSIEFHTTHRVPSYQDWFEASPQTGAYRWHRRYLQSLQSRDRHEGRLRPAGTPRRWVLKAPGHLFGLDALLAAYPDAVLVQTHRDPMQVVGSISSHGVILREAFSASVDRHEVAVDWSSRWAAGLARTLAMRQADPALDDRILDLHYADVVADPIGTVGRIYRHADLEMSPAALDRMRKFMEANPQGRHGRHHYTLEQFGLEEDRERARYGAYRAFLNL
jgi:hypothetical protein